MIRPLAVGFMHLQWLTLLLNGCQNVNRQSAWRKTAKENYDEQKSHNKFIQDPNKQQCLILENMVDLKFEQEKEFAILRYHQVGCLFNNISSQQKIKLNLMQTTCPELLQFHEEYDSFSLMVTFAKNKLSFDLKDYADGVIFSKEYQEDDVGKEIHKKMDLFDVFSAFAQTKVSSDEQSMKSKQGQKDKLKKYQIGEIIKNKNTPCFKIESGGKITTYWTMVQKITNKQVILESKLSLNRVRSLTQAEIAKQKSSIEKYIVFEELSEEIQKHKIQNEKLELRIVKLEEENWKLKAKNEQIQKELKQLKEELVSKIDSAKQDQAQQLHQTKNQLNLSIASHDQQNKAINHQIQQKAQQNQANIKDLHKAINQIQEKIAYIFFPQPYSHLFKVNGYKIQYTGPNQQWTQYFANKPIPHNCTTRLKIKITQTSTNRIFVGILDYEKQKDARQSRTSGNSLCYYGYNGHKCPQNTTQGGGFMQGDMVEIDVDRTGGSLKYAINGVLKATQVNQMLVNSSRVFMPFAELHFTGDAIQWLFD